MKTVDPAKLPATYPWVEHVRCTGCGCNYKADYRQERDWSRCPRCTGEAGKPCRNHEDFTTATNLHAAGLPARKGVTDE